MCDTHSYFPNYPRELTHRSRSNCQGLPFKLPSLICKYCFRCFRLKRPRHLSSSLYISYIAGWCRVLQRVCWRLCCTCRGLTSFTSGFHFVLPFCVSNSVCRPLVSFDHMPSVISQLKCLPLIADLVPSSVIYWKRRTLASIASLAEEFSQSSMYGTSSGFHTCLVHEWHVLWHYFSGAGSESPWFECPTLRSAVRQ
jgi:hypothetical protein